MSELGRWVDWHGDTLVLEERDGDGVEIRIVSNEGSGYYWQGNERQLGEIASTLALLTDAPGFNAKTLVEIEELADGLFE